MPCNSEYMNPTVRERQQRLAAQLLVYVYESLQDIVPEHVRYTAENEYGFTKQHDRNMVTLCTLLNLLTPEEQQRIIFDGRKPMARKLAEWWEEHRTEDSNRALIELKNKKDAETAAEFFKNTTLVYEEAIAAFASALSVKVAVEDSYHVMELTDGVLVATRMDGISIWKGVKL